MIRMDLHVHSCFSMDCFLKPERIVELALKNGLNGFAVTDHDVWTDPEIFRKLAPELLIIGGQEISSPCGDILGLFLHKKIEETRNVEKILSEIRGQKGLAVLAHPYKWPHLFRAKDFLRKFDAIEVFNARNNIPSPYLENALAQRAVRSLGLAFTAGSDTHEGFEMGCTATVFDCDRRDAADEVLKKAILEKKVTVAGSREVNLGLEIISHFSRLMRSRSQ